MPGNPANPMQPNASLANPISGVAGIPAPQNVMRQTQGAQVAPPVAAVPPAPTMQEQLATAMQQRQMQDPMIMRQLMGLLGPQGPAMANAPTLGGLMQPSMATPQAMAQMAMPGQTAPLIPNVR